MDPAIRSDTRQAVHRTGGPTHGHCLYLGGAAQAGSDITAAAATGGASFGSLSAGRDATVTASSGTIGVSGATTVGRNYSATAQNFTGSALSPTVPGDLTKTAQSNDTTSATVWLSGGTAGRDHAVAVTITTAAGRTKQRSMKIMVRDQ